MTQRRETTPAPGLLEAFAQEFDSLFGRWNQREGLRRYLEGLLLPAERNKTVTGLANTAPGKGAQEARAQSLQWFLSESNWDEAALNERRRALIRQTPALAPNAEGVLILDETGDLKDGTHTAHVGRQYLGNVGKIGQGVVSVSSLWADEQVYYPLEVIPYTPSDWFARGKKDPAFRTKLTIAIDLVKQAVAWQWPFKAVVADSFYGEDATVREYLHERGIGFVMALKPSHSWWHFRGELGSLKEIAQLPNQAWTAVERTFRDGHRERWWALEIQAGPYGPRKLERAVVVTTDPETLPELSTWYLVTNLPLTNTRRGTRGPRTGASLEEVVRLYGLRNWVEQSYKQVKSTLGWAQYQVRKSRAIRRHWILVYCAFTFCWWQAAQPAGTVTPIADPALQPKRDRTTTPRPGEKKPRRSQSVPRSHLARRAQASPKLAGAGDHAQALLVRLFAGAPSLRNARTARVAATRERHQRL
jgi:SRSO17 transposase